tara:strand:+ start:92 stop:661 length:570 start_codon:yes stop_codon:yes gene_type:complete
MRTVILLSILFVTCQSDDFISFEKLQENSIEGQTIFYYDNKKFSGKVYKKSNDKISLEFELKDGRYNGFFKEFYPGGSIKKEVNYENGILQGYENNYFENGVMSETVNYNNGKFHGSRFVYWENGIVKEKNTFNNGVLVGNTTYYYSNGKIRKEIKFDSQGKKDGEWIDYDAEGNKIKVEYFKSGIKLD